MELIDIKINNILKDFTLSNSDKIKPTTNINQGYSITINSRAEFKISETSTDIQVFTDGSKDEHGNTGYGAHFTDQDLGVSILGPLHTFNSVYQAEVAAILVATNYLSSLNVSNRVIHFYSDSQAAIKALDNTTLNSQITKQCSDALNNLASNNITVNLNWIPGHSDYNGNELADHLAKLGSKQVAPRLPIGPPHKSLIHVVQSHFALIHCNRWKNSNLSEHCRFPINAALNKVGFSLPTLARSISPFSPTDIRILTACLTGHNNLNYHLTTIKYAYDECCDYCSLDADFHPETATHIICECDKFCELRMKYFELNFHTSLQDIFNRPYKSLRASFQDIINFMKETKSLSKKPKLTKNQLSPNRILPKPKSNPKATCPLQDKSRQTILTDYRLRL